MPSRTRFVRTRCLSGQYVVGIRREKTAGNTMDCERLFIPILVPRIVGGFDRVKGSSHLSPDTNVSIAFDGELDQHSSFPSTLVVHISVPHAPKIARNGGNESIFKTSVSIEIRIRDLSFQLKIAVSSSFTPLWRGGGLNALFTPQYFLSAVVPLYYSFRACG